MEVEQVNIGNSDQLGNDHFLRHEINDELVRQLIELNQNFSQKFEQLTTNFEELNASFEHLELSFARQQKELKELSLVIVEQAECFRSNLSRQQAIFVEQLQLQAQQQQNDTRKLNEKIAEKCDNISAKIDAQESEFTFLWQEQENAIEVLTEETFNKFAEQRNEYTQLLENQANQQENDTVVINQKLNEIISNG